MEAFNHHTEQAAILVSQAHLQPPASWPSWHGTGSEAHAPGRGQLNRAEMSGMVS